MIQSCVSDAILDALGRDFASFLGAKIRANKGAYLKTVDVYQIRLFAIRNDDFCYNMGNKKRRKIHAQTTSG